MATGGQVRAVWFTSGGLSPRRRQAESHRAMEILGVPRQNLLEMGLPDGHLLDCLGEVVRRLVDLMAVRRPASVFVPAFEGGHPDHDSLQLAAAAAISRVDWEVNRQPALFEFPLYHRSGGGIAVGDFLPGGGAAFKTALKLKDRLLKQRLARIYRSQRLILYPLLALKGGPMMMNRRGEPYRLVPPGRDYTRPPHPGRLAYEFYTRRRFKEFASAAEAVIH